MNCTFHSLRDLVLDHRSRAEYIVERLTNPNSDFHSKLSRKLAGEPVTEDDGNIAIVVADDLLVGWARSEKWIQRLSRGDKSWSTLEAYVHPAWRSRGVAMFAAAGLFVGLHRPLPPHAVFAPSMLLLATKVGVKGTLFLKDAFGEWVLA